MPVRALAPRAGQNAIVTLHTTNTVGSAWKHASAASGPVALYWATEERRAHEIAVSYTLPLSSGLGLELYVAPAGEPLGPTAFPLLLAQPSFDEPANLFIFGERERVTIAFVRLVVAT